MPRLRAMSPMVARAVGPTLTEPVAITALPLTRSRHPYDTARPSSRLQSTEPGKYSLLGSCAAIFEDPRPEAAAGRRCPVPCAECVRLAAPPAVASLVGAHSTPPEPGC